jgi:predicted O-linked N-acetylglucosamine transferase (SPINDLY family)
VIERVRLAPYQSVESYFRLVQAADVLLDPIHYGGGLTSLDGLSLNKPIVTMPGPFVRGRYTFGFYRTMGLTDCVAANADDYVERAVRLGRDREWRAHVESRIRDTSDVLFESSDSIAEYDRIFRQLVDEALTKGT